MGSTQFCQSCSMPLDGPELHGTEKDGSISNDYCKFCYKDGKFTDPDLTLARMQSSISNRMDKENIPADIIEAAVARLPHLKRWKAAFVFHKTKKSLPVVQVHPPDEKHPLEEVPPPGPLAESEDELDLVSGEEPEVIEPEKPY